MIELEDVRRLYDTMSANLAIARRRLRTPLGLADKLLYAHLADPEHGAIGPSAELRTGDAEYLSLRPDRVVLQDVLGQTAFLQFAQTGRERVAIPTSVHCDHLVRAQSGATADLARSLAENGEVYAFLRSAAARYGAGFWAPGAGIIHQVVLENYAFPGALILGTDSHTPNASGLGACAIGVGGADAVEAMAGLPWELPRPRRIAVVLSGSLHGWTAPKDVVLWVVGQLGVSGATHSIVEYIGPGAQTLSATGKATIANMGAEMGATTSLFAADESIDRYLEATGRGALRPLIAQHRALFEPDPEVLADPPRFYDRVLQLDLDRLEPHVVGPHSPDRARPLSELAAEVRANGWPDSIAAALIGSCTNSSYQDMSRAADVAAQAIRHGMRARTAFYVTPGSERVRRTIERDGQLAALRAIGGEVLANACGPCIGQWDRQDPTDPSSIVSSYNRNFPGRNDGRTSTLSFLASPEIVLALALAGGLSFDPRRDPLIDAEGKAFFLEAPAPAPDVPESSSGGAT